MRIVIALSLVALGAVRAQDYRCDWSVVGIGGGIMAGSNYVCGSTVGQTAAGRITGANYWSLIGFWQTEAQTGVREEARWSSGQVIKTALYRPFPVPAIRSATIRYSLDAQHQTLLQIHDVTGRAVRTLCAASMKRGVYSATWDGRDQLGRSLPHGVYFCRMTAGDYRASEKLVMQR